MPHELHQRTWTWRFESPPDRIWPLLADTARFNEAAGLPQHEIEEKPRADGSVEYIGRVSMGPFRLVWEEEPVNWVSHRWFRHRRVFRQGPLESLCATFELTPDGTGSRGLYRLEARAANLVGEVILRAGFFKNTARTFGAAAASADRHAQGERATAFDYQAPDLGAEVRARVTALVEGIEASSHGHGLAARLGDLLLSAQEVDLIQLRPLRLARLWDVPPRAAIELCLEATPAGLRSLRWDLLCPRCRVAKAVVAALDQLPRGAHCGTCNIDYDRDFSKNVELSFQPAPAIRPLGVGEYCLFGPMSTPHIHIHLTVAPGETRSTAAHLAPGPYRLRTLETGPELDIEVAERGFPEVIAKPEAMAAGAAAPAGEIRLTNRCASPRTLVVEERHWVRDALTADRVTSLQAFRDLFSDQVLRPGDEVALGRIALLFTDLRASTALYSQIGDAAAYHLVREHFAFLAAIVREHEGAVVKTIGDAIMAAFADPADALRAGLAVQRRVAHFNAEQDGQPIVIKLGLHEGPCIAVTLNDRLDYFGSTVNLAARLQQQSVGGDVVLSATMAETPAVKTLLAELSAAAETAQLKGFDEAVGFLRLKP